MKNRDKKQMEGLKPNMNNHIKCNIPNTNKLRAQVVRLD